MGFYNSGLGSPFFRIFITKPLIFFNWIKLLKYNFKMLYLYEFLFTFFLIFFYTTDTKFASAQTASIIFTTFIAYSLDKNTYLNTGIAFSFLFTGYRNFL